MKPISFFASLLLLTSPVFWGCTKSNPSNQPSPNAVDSFQLDANGILYLKVDDTLRRLDVKTGSSDWGTALTYHSGSGQSPLNFDSGYIYQGSIYGLATYNYRTGAMIWMTAIPPEPGSTLGMYRATAINDSLVFYTGPTGVFFGGGKLYCAYKRSGDVLWETLIDSNSLGFKDFNSIPYLANGKVILLIRDMDGHKRIGCFHAGTGASVWNTTINDDLSSRLLVTDDHIYAAQGQYAYCYSAKDGSLQWRTDMGFSGGEFKNYPFLDHDRLIVARNGPVTSNAIRIFNAINGDQNSSQTFEVPAATDLWRYTYDKGVLYITSQTTDSVELTAYNIDTKSVKWRYRYSQLGAWSAIVTDKYFIFPSGIGRTPLYENAASQMTFLDLNGSLVKQVPYRGVYTNSMLYVDSTGTVYKEQDR